MIILHLAAVENDLVLWGESSLSNGEPTAVSRTAKSKNPYYPYDAGPSELTWILKDKPVDLTRLVMSQREMTLWSPTRGKRPVPSSMLIDDPPLCRARLRIAPWTITGFSATTHDAAELIMAAAGRRVISSGLTAGADLAFWGEAMRYAGSMIARQQYLPDIKKIGAKYHAFWRPFYGEADQVRVSDLADRMPPAARAVTDAASNQIPEVSPLIILKAFMGRMLDHLVRLCLKEKASAPGRKRKVRGSGAENAHDAWLTALTGPDPVINASPDELAELLTSVRAWSRPLALAASSPYRLCFRLEEPEDMEPESGKITGANEWRVRFLLQPRDDPSLLAPLDMVWGKKKKKSPVFKNGEQQVKEYTLTALGQAAGICPRIAGSLETADPTGYSLDDEGAYEFLTEKAMSLEQAGFGVMLPAWWAGRQARLKPKARVTAKSPLLTGSGTFSLQTIVEFDWQVSLGDHDMTIEELEALAVLKSPLVKFRGQWVEMRAEDINSALEQWRKNGKGRAEVRDLLKMSLGAESPAPGLEIEEFKAEGRLGELLDRLDGRTAFKEEEIPAGFSGNLRPYQVRGFSWLSFLKQWGLGACLADDMGLGKTIQTLALLEKEREAGETRPALLICPTSVVNNWYREALTFTPGIQVMVHHGLGRRKGKMFVKAAAKSALVVSTYGLLQRELKTFQSVEWAGLILDEAQNIKNPQTKQSKAARSIAADYRAALTGTPVENHVGDLWSIMEFLNPGFLGSQTEFRRRYHIPIQTGSDPDAAERLKKITGPFILRRTKTDKNIISDLPDKIDMKTYCHLTREQASLYASVVKDLENSISGSDGIQRKGLVLAALSKLKQICNHPAHFLGDNSAVNSRSGKLTRLEELLEEIMQVNEYALVFTQFREMGFILKKHLQEIYGREILFLHGGTSKTARDRMVDRFQSDPQAPPVFILSLKAGGTGLNLTRANHVFHFDRWWNPAVENQATDRVFRIGQKKNVQVHKMVCLGTLEERIDEMIEAKKDTAERVIGAGEAWLTEFSNDELRNLLALSRNAVEE